MPEKFRCLNSTPFNYCWGIDSQPEPAQARTRAEGRRIPGRQSIFGMLKSFAALFALLAAILTVVSLNPWNRGDETTALYLDSGSYGEDSSFSAPSDRGVVFDYRTETPAYDGTHNIANFGIKSGSVDPACAVLPRNKCLPSNLAEWRHGSPLPKKYAEFVKSIDRQWAGPEVAKSAANPGSKEARFFFQQAKQSDESTHEPPWDHPNEAAKIFGQAPIENAAIAHSKQFPAVGSVIEADGSISAPVPSGVERSGLAGSKLLGNFEGTSSATRNEGDNDGDDSIRQMRSEISELKEEVQRAKERQELERRAAKLQAELRKMNSGEEGEDAGAAGVHGTFIVA